MEKVRKDIHLPAPVARSLARIAAASGKTSKKYMEDLIVEKTKTRMARLKKSNGG